MRGYGDSDKPAGVKGYDARALAEEFRALVRQIGFGGGKPIILAAHDMGAPPALLWAADHPEEVAGLLYIEAPVMLSAVLAKVIAYTPEAMKEGSMWWWVLPLAPKVPELLVVGNERAFLTWFYDKHTAHRDAITPADVDETMRTFAGREGVLGAMGDAHKLSRLPRVYPPGGSGGSHAVRNVPTAKAAVAFVVGSHGGDIGLLLWRMVVAVALAGIARPKHCGVNRSSGRDRPVAVRRGTGVAVLSRHQTMGSRMIENTLRTHALRNLVIT
jgi:pimeloyl-ACP methyl ester carboxylesterase